MALPVNGSTHLIPAYYSFYRPRKDERLSWPSWLTYSGWLTHISGHPSAAGRAQDRESSRARDRRSTTVPRSVAYCSQPVCMSVAGVSQKPHVQTAPCFPSYCQRLLLRLPLISNDKVIGYYVNMYFRFCELRHNYLHIMEMHRRHQYGVWLKRLITGSTDPLCPG